MHIHFLDPFRPLRSPVHALDARIKLPLALAFILTCSLTRPAAWPVFVLLTAVALCIEILSGLGIVYVLKRSALALPFALAALPVVFSTEGQQVFGISVGAFTLSASIEGLGRFVSIMLKSWLSIQAAIVLAASTPFPELLQAMRAIGAPKLLVAMFGLMWRYLFVLVDEGLRLMQARSARSGQRESGASAPGGSIAWRARVTGGMAGNLLVRAFERSERIYSAMLARGYDGETRSLPLPPINSAAWIALAIGLFVCVFLVLLGLVTGT
jgi:cobalt/nickel transport system permease protein